MSEVKEQKSLTEDEDTKLFDRLSKGWINSQAILAAITLIVMTAGIGVKKMQDWLNSGQPISAEVSNAVQVAMDSNPDAWANEDTIDQPIP